MTALDAARTVLITGAGRGLGRATADRLLHSDPDLHVVAAVRDARTVPTRDRFHPVTCDLASLTSVRVAAREVTALLDDGRVPPLRGLIGNAGVQTGTGAQASADGYELTFATNVLGHFVLVRDLLDRLTTPARVVLVSSATHRGDFMHSGGLVPPPRWTSPEALARPGTGAEAQRAKSGQRAYTTSKLGVIHLVHELARRAPTGVDVYSFDPLMMPGTGLAREGSAVLRAAWHSVFHLSRALPWATSPAGAAKHLAAAVLGPRPAESGAYLEMGKVVQSAPESYDPARERDLWQTLERLAALPLDQSR